jgi:small subunit ribosomal protein S10
MKVCFKSFSQKHSVSAIKACFHLLKKAPTLYVRHISLPTKKKKFTVLKSPHVNKKSREQFMLQTFKHIIVIKCAVSTSAIEVKNVHKAQFTESITDVLTAQNTKMSFENETNLFLKKFLLGLYELKLPGVEMKINLLTNTYLENKL